jgi:hypothetical protein
MKRIGCLFVLLLFIAGNSLVGAHAATHAQMDLSECELCAAYADPSDAIPAAEHTLPPMVANYLAFEYGEHPETLFSVLVAQSRGPPHAI